MTHARISEHCSIPLDSLPCLHVCIHVLYLPIFVLVHLEMAGSFVSSCVLLRSVDTQDLRVGTMPSPQSLQHLAGSTLSRSIPVTCGYSCAL